MPTSYPHTSDYETIDVPPYTAMQYRGRIYTNNSPNYMRFAIVLNSYAYWHDNVERKIKKCHLPEWF